MLFTSPVYSQASGSIAGITYGHGRGGMFVRARKTPTNPDSERQRTIRHALATLGSYWGQTLSAAERDGWRLYAANVPWRNVLGHTTFLTGHQHFVRTNVVRIQASIAILNTAPIIFDLGTFTAPTISRAVENTQDVLIAYDNTDAWANGVGGYILGWPGRTTSFGESYYAGPWRFAGKEAGAVIPPTSPFDMIAPWFITFGNQLWVKIRFIQIDGRMSLPIILGPEVIAPV